MLNLPDVALIIGTAMMLLSVAELRTRRRQSHNARMQKYRDAADLLNRHAEALALVLDAPETPDNIKRVLFQCSEGFSDKTVVIELAKWMSGRNIADVGNSAEKSALDEDFAAFKSAQPDLANAFVIAVLCGVMGSVLRFPESAALFNQVGPRIVANPKPDLTLAVMAAKMQSALGLGHQTVSHAAA